MFTNRRSAPKLVALLALALTIAGSADAAGPTYYIDNNNLTGTASDSNNGLTKTTAWIDAPGDSAATGTPASLIRSTTASVTAAANQPVVTVSNATNIAANWYVTWGGPLPSPIPPGTQVQSVSSHDITLTKNLVAQITSGDSLAFSQFGPGATLQFEGGETYSGTINMAASGWPNNPLVYEGSGWNGQATLGGWATPQAVSFTTYAPVGGLCQGTLPANWLVGLYNIVRIDGTTYFLSNNSLSTDRYAPYSIGNPVPRSELSIVPSTSVIISDSGNAAGIKAIFDAMPAGWATNAYMALYENSTNNDSQFAVGAYSGGVVTLNYHWTTLGLGYSSGYNLPQAGTVNTYDVIYNNPNFLTGTLPYPMYAFSYSGTTAGSQATLIAPVSCTTHNVSVPTSAWAFKANSTGVTHHDFTIDGFAVNGFGPNGQSPDGRAFYLDGAWNFNITGNTFTDISGAAHSSQAVLSAKLTHNSTISGNFFGPNLPYLIAMTVSSDTIGGWTQITNNYFNEPGWDAMFCYDCSGIISGNDVENLTATHGIGLAAYMNFTALYPMMRVLTIENNLFNYPANAGDFTNGGQAAIGMEGDPGWASGCGSACGVPDIPQKLVVDRNVARNAIQGFVDLGSLNGANVYSNIWTTPFGSANATGGPYSAGATSMTIGSITGSAPAFDQVVLDATTQHNLANVQSYSPSTITFKTGITSGASTSDLLLWTTASSIKTYGDDSLMVTIANSLLTQYSYDVSTTHTYNNNLAQFPINAPANGVNNNYATTGQWNTLLAALAAGGALDGTSCGVLGLKAGTTLGANAYHC